MSEYSLDQKSTVGPSAFVMLRGLRRRSMVHHSFSRRRRSFGAATSLRAREDGNPTQAIAAVNDCTSRRRSKWFIFDLANQKADDEVTLKEELAASQPHQVRGAQT